MACPYLEYRSGDDEHEFDHERPYCTVAEAFVSPMKADICNDRHEFDHTSDCEMYPDDDGQSESAVLSATGTTE